MNRFVIASLYHVLPSKTYLTVKFCPTTYISNSFI